MRTDTPKVGPSVAIYLGSRFGNDDKYRETAVEIADLLAKNGCELVYGGGNVGLMGTVANGVIEGGGRTFGVITRGLFEREVAHLTLDELVVTETMSERKLAMIDRADCFICLPGGIGTLEELFEVWTWKSLRMHNKPIGLLNVDGYFDGLLSFVSQTVSDGFTSERALPGLVVHNSPARLFDLVVSAIEVEDTGSREHGPSD